jgi:hypothetical protein
MTPTQFDALLSAITDSKLAARLDRIERRQIEIQTAIGTLADRLSHPSETVEADPAADHPELPLDADLESPDLADIQRAPAAETPVATNDVVTEKPIPEGIPVPDRAPSLGMRWAYVGDGSASSVVFGPGASLSPVLSGEVAWMIDGIDDESFTYITWTRRNGGTSFHYFLAVPA